MRGLFSGVASVLTACKWTGCRWTNIREEMHGVRDDRRIREGLDRTTYDTGLLFYDRMSFCEHAISGIVESFIIASLDLRNLDRCHVTLKSKSNTWSDEEVVVPPCTNGLTRKSAAGTLKAVPILPYWGLLPM